MYVLIYAVTRETRRPRISPQYPRYSKLPFLYACFLWEIHAVSRFFAVSAQQLTKTFTTWFVLYPTSFLSLNISQILVEIFDSFICFAVCKKTAQIRHMHTQIMPLTGDIFDIIRNAAVLHVTNIYLILRLVINYIFCLYSIIFQLLRAELPTKIS